jgi:transcriptional regulator GlxA family with amidase domain
MIDEQPVMKLLPSESSHAMASASSAGCIHALRRHAPAAQNDDLPVIAGAWAALERPEGRTVDELGRRAGMSRSRFSERFLACRGEPPIRWLRRQRLERAARLLEGGGLSVAEVAERFGYESETAFRKAYSA